MKTNLSVILAVGLLAGPVAAIATPVSWQLQGTLNVVSGTDLPSGFTTGSAFGVVVNFDTSAPIINAGLCATGGIGTICRYGDPTVSFTDLRLGTFVNGVFVGNVTPSSGNVIIRNNLSFSDPDFGTRLVDGISFVATNDYGADGFTNFQVVFRGPQDLGLVTDASVIPTDPLPGLLSLDIRNFQICDESGNATTGCDLAFVDGTITSVTRVPEPATLALLGLGLAGVGFARKRKARAV